MGRKRHKKIHRTHRKIAGDSKKISEIKKSDSEKKIETPPVVSEIQKLRQELESMPEQEIEEPITDTEQEDSFKQLCKKSLELPYEKIAELTKFENFKLSEKESDLNGLLLDIIIVEYLPKMNLGKLAVWVFIIFNIGLIVEKSVELNAYYKKIKKETIK